jgi:hypothetical protein
MMKKFNNHRFSEISSFDDFHHEKERLLLKRKLIETKLYLSYSRITNSFSISKSIFSLVKEYVIPKFTNLFSELIKKAVN